MFLANTRVAVIRGITESTLGDEVETNGAEGIVAAFADMPAALTERSRSVFDPATGTRRTVRVITCRIPVSVGHPTTGVITPLVLLEGDRIKDNNTGRIYALDEHVAVPRNLAGMSSLTLDLKATASA